jgi:hypothetical protein
LLPFLHFMARIQLSIVFGSLAQIGPKIAHPAS